MTADAELLAFVRATGSVLITGEKSYEHQVNFSRLVYFLRPLLTHIELRFLRAQKLFTRYIQLGLL